MVLIPEAWEGYGHAAVGVNVTGAEGIYYVLNEGKDNQTLPSEASYHLSIGILYHCPEVSFIKNL